MENLTIDITNKIVEFTCKYCDTQNIESFNDLETKGSVKCSNVECQHEYFIKLKK